MEEIYMTLFNFQLLSDPDKTALLYDQGTYIGKRKAGAQTVLLYQLEGFYVEIFYLKHRMYIQKIHCFSSTALLDPYLDQISVAYLVKL